MSNEEAIEMAEKKNKILKKAREEINYLTGDAAVRRLAELREDWKIDYAMGVNGAKRAGFEDGQKTKEKEIAQNLLKLGMEIEKIQRQQDLRLKK